MKKRALIVGINSYHYSLVPQLKYCRFDALSMMDLLQRRGFELLTLHDAHKAGIVDGLIWLGEGLGDGERAVFYNSSHGTPTTDFSGDEEDGYDEAIVPSDYDGRPQSLLTDDEIGAIISKYHPGVELEVILDCCHSGTGTRGIGRKSAPKWLHVESGMNHVCLAACREEQTAGEGLVGVEGREGHGTMSGALFEEIEADPAITRLQLVERINQRLRAGLHDQVAQLEGPARLINGYPFGGL